MILDARTTDIHDSMEADVCIVGAGTAGITLGREFIGQPFRVCLLESGGHEVDFDTQSLCCGESTGYPYYPLETARVRCYSGTSTRWKIPLGGDRLGARLRPMDALDLSRREWVDHSGWPVRPEDLAPYYDRAQTLCHVDPPSWDPRDWSDPTSRPLLPFGDGDVQSILYKFVPRELFVREYPDAVARADNITVVLHANALELETNPAGDWVTRIRAGAIGKQPFHVKAKWFLLATGGLETPRLLLLSNRTHTNGLGNQHDQVGRYFMEHLHFWSGIVVPNRTDWTQSAGFYSEIHSKGKVTVIGKLTLTEKAIARERLLNQNVQLIPRMMPDPFQYPPSSPQGVQSLKYIAKSFLKGRPPAEFGRHLRQMFRELDQIGTAASRKFREKWRGLPQLPVYILANMVEQEPDPNNRVTLGEDRDLFGQRRLKLHWQISDKAIQSAARTHALLASEWQCTGLARLYLELNEDAPPSDTHGGYHHMGTTRMHNDPKHGVVDADCRVHGLDNLFIAGPSVFTTGGYANPVLSFIALSLRLADHIKDRFQ